MEWSLVWGKVEQEKVQEYIKVWKEFMCTSMEEVIVTLAIMHTYTEIF